MLIILFCYVITYLVMRMRQKVHIPVTYYDENDDASELLKESCTNSDDSAESFLLQDSPY